MASAHLDSDQVTGQQATKPAKKSPAVRLQLSVTENEVLHQQEIIRKVTKVHEVVEVDGFFFKRKRRTPLGESDNVQASAKKLKPRQKAQSSDGAAGMSLQQEVASPNQDGQAAEGVGSVPQATAHGQQGAHPMQAQEAVQMPPASDHLEAAEAALASLPKDIGSEPERLMVLCEKLAEEELKSAEGSPGAEFLQRMLERFLEDVRASLGNGTLQCRDRLLQKAAAAESQRRLRSELEAQKAVLSARLDRFLQEEAEWNAMLESSRAVAEGAANAAATAAPADAQPADGPASADAAAQPDAPIGEGDVRPDAEGAALGSNAGQGGLERAPGLLQQAQMEAHRGLTLQVEGLSAMVEGVRELVAAADQITSAEFDKLYKEKFSALPGLNSPARLIREITRPPHSRFGPPAS